MPGMNNQQSHMPRVNQQQSQMSQMNHQQSKTFTGTVFKEDGHYVLLSGTNTYQLSNQNLAGKYNNKRVKVTGKLASNGKTIHVKSITKTKPSY